jgi:hypothetical protein
MNARTLGAKHDPPANDKPRDKTADSNRVIVEIDDGEITEQMRAAYQRFWQLVIGRVLANASDAKDQAPPTV